MKMRSLVSPFALVLVAVACSGGGPTDAIEISGSSTVAPITELIAEDFNAANQQISISVEGPGTGDGFARFCAGETDISNASRLIQPSEVAECSANGVEYVELHVATDGIAVITSSANNSYACLDFHDLYALVGPESEGFDNWNDADSIAAELNAGNAPYADAPLVITAPGEESGTYDTFVELVIEEIAEERGQEIATRVDYEASATDNVIVQGISGNDTSLGWVGYAFYSENTDHLNAIEIDDGDGCVAPTEENIASFSYPLSRPLYIYVNSGKAESKPSLARFVDFYLSDTGLQSVTEAGYVALPPEDIESTVGIWNDR